MDAWAAANIKLRAANDAMNEHKRREALAADVSVTPSCGNVFADLGLPDADRLLAEADAHLAAGTTPPWAKRSAPADCGCTAGAICRRNAACPRAKARKAAQQVEAQRLYRAEAA